MITVHLFPQGVNSLSMFTDIEIGILQEQVEWLRTLPKTNRGKDPFKFKVGCDAIYFSRNDDAVAFKLKFGL